ncbi:MAG TPA: aminopeptidase P N-terminal domain-containing protein [Ignavibacteria bacterium]|nr:aminopeptidase P N-terminal domain-containing protein [Ignavibacteria bacterium]
MNNAQKSFHKSRRNELMKRIGKNSIAVIISNSLRNKSFDAQYKFKQNKNFYYLTGFDEPDSILVLAPGGIKVKGQSGKTASVKEILFVPKNDPDYEKWYGVRLGYERVKQGLGIEFSMENIAFNDVVTSLAGFDNDKIYTNIIELYDSDGELEEITAPFINKLRVASSWCQIIDVNFILGEMRKVKLPFELQLMQKAADITAMALNSVLKQLKPGMYEYQVQALLEYNYINGGATDIAFDTIIASGSNACILHYITNREKIKDGSLVLMDNGAEYEYYCADITRTFPANGKFTPEQRTIYDIVLKANEYGIKLCKSGVKYTSLNKQVKKFMADELVKHKVIKDPDTIGRFCYHGIGHDLGLDTHDAVPFGKNPQYDTLKEGNVMTIEPGLYFLDYEDGYDKKYKGIGIRIEDDVLITKTGRKVLTSGITKDPDEIEKIMNTKQ